jgi:membrane protease YdiL (CAAX protease family)
MAQILFLRDRSPLFNILFLAALALFCAGIFSLLAFAGIELFWGIPVFSDKTALSNFNNPDVLNAMKFLQAMYSIGLFIVPCFVFLKLTNIGTNSNLELIDLNDNISKSIEEENDAFSFLKMKTFPAIISLLIVFGIMLVVQPLVELTGKWNAAFPFPEAFGIADWIKQTEGQGEVVTKAFLNADSVYVFLLNVFIMAFLPALGEEIFFRGMIQQYMTKAVKNVYIAIIITAIIFSAFHFQFMGFLPRMLLGIILGCIFVWSRNIWLAVFAHFLNNGAAVTLDYLNQRNVISEEQLESVASDNVLVVVLSLVLLVMLLFVLHKQRKHELQSQ